MTDSQQAKCQDIIHTHAPICAAGNLAPVPGLGFSVDIVAMGSMCMCLADVFGGSISEEVAKELAVAALKRTLLKHHIKPITKGLVMPIPVLGQIVILALAIIIIEEAGWCMAKELERRANAMCPAPAAG